MRFLNFIFLTLSPLSIPTFAQQFIANCHESASALKQAEGRMSDNDRMRSLGNLYKEIEELEKTRLQKSSTPQRFLSDCLERKSKTVDTHIKMASTNLKNSAGFNLLLGRFYVMEDIRDTAVIYFDRGLKLHPNDLDLLTHAYTNWLEIWKTETAQDLVKYKSESARYLDPLMKHPQLPKKSKCVYLANHAEALKRYQAFADSLIAYKKILELDPNHLGARKELAEDALRRKSYDEALEHYQKLRFEPSLETESLNRIAEIYRTQGRPQEALRLVNGLIKESPRERLRVMRAELLFRSDRWDEGLSASTTLAQELIKKRARSDEENENRKLLATLLSEQAAASKQQPPNRIKKRLALLLYDRAAALDETENNYKHLYVTEFIKEHRRSPLPSAFGEKAIAFTLSLSSQHEWPSDELEAMADLSLKLKNNEAFLQLCRAVENSFTLPSRFELLVACTKTYRANKEKAAAKRLLEKALLDSQYEKYRDKIKSELSEI